MGRYHWVVAVLLFVLSGCAQVPKESVELSVTVGRDLAEIHKAHRELVILFYERIENDINDFIDDVYTPYQIQKTLEEHGNLLSSVIREAGRPDPSGEAQEKVIAFLRVYLEEVRNEVETYRRQKLDPIENQKSSLLAKIDESYERIHYANSIVTGHLASVVKVHDTQNEILAELDLADLRLEVGEKAVELSERLDEFLIEARKGKKKVEKLSTELDILIREYAK
jgi:hypothetical protein